MNAGKIIKKKMESERDENLGGSEGRVATRSGLRNRETAAGKGSITVELARIHGEASLELNCRD